VPRLDPVPQRQTGDLTSLDATPGARVHILYGGLRVLQVRHAQQPGTPAVITAGKLLLHQQA
jgi:hypothetical protein